MEKPAPIYDRAYFLEDCEGFGQFLETAGKRLSKRLRKVLALVEARPGERIVDVGCGRGEIALHLAASGATVLAVDPAAAALRLLGEAEASWPSKPPDRGPGHAGTLRRPLRLRSTGERLPLPQRWAHAVILSDVVEHVPPSRLGALLRECRNTLIPAGRLVIHTQPNRTLLRVTVPVLARISPLWGVRLPRDLRSELTRGSSLAYHPGELSRRRLRRALDRAGLEIQELWLEGSWAVHRIFGESRIKAPILRAFRRSGVLKDLFATQIFAVARRPV